MDHPSATPLNEHHQYAKMAEDTSLTQAQLVARLADGFAALLKQVDELKRHSEAMEKLLGNKPEVGSSRILPHVSRFVLFHDDTILALDL